MLRWADFRNVIAKFNGNRFLKEKNPLANALTLSVASLGLRDAMKIFCIEVSLLLRPRAHHKVTQNLTLWKHYYSIRLKER